MISLLIITILYLQESANGGLEFPSSVISSRMLDSFFKPGLSDTDAGSFYPLGISSAGEIYSSKLDTEFKEEFEFITYSSPSGLSSSSPPRSHPSPSGLPGFIPSPPGLSSENRSSLSQHLDRFPHGLSPFISTTAGTNNP